MNYFDTHAHLGLIHNDPIEQLLAVEEGKQYGVTGVISICNSLVDFFQIYKNLTSANNVYFGIGVSPSEVDFPGERWEEKLVEGAALPKVVALGETGLDYYKKFGNKTAQVELFIRQLEMAEYLKMPVIIHNREAGKDITDILKTKMPSRGAVLHCYSENREYAETILKNHDNIYFSFAGNVTFRNAKNLHETIVAVPLNRILIESESPFMTPNDHKGKRNRPAYLPSVAKFVAHLREEDDEEVLNALYQNAVDFFGIPSS